MSTGKLFYTSIVLITLYSVAKCDDICKVSNLPEFQATELEQVIPVEDDRVSVLIPSYIFTCAGYVTQWRAHVNGRRNTYDRYDLTFSIWRKNEMDNECEFMNIDKNFHTGLTPEVDANNTALGTLTFNVPGDKRVLVQPGDFVGIDVRHYEVTGQGIPPVPASIIMDTNKTDVKVYIMPYPLQSTVRCINESYDGVDALNFPQQLTAAPIITMEIVPVSSCTNSSTAASIQPHTSILTSTVSSTAVQSTSSQTASDQVSVHPTISSLSLSTSSIPSTTSRDDFTQTTLTIIITATLLAVSMTLIALAILLLACVVWKRNKKASANDQDDTDGTYMEIDHTNRYSYTTPGRYNSDKFSNSGQHKVVYDTLAPEPLPCLNPTLTSNSTNGPSFLCHSSETSSSLDGGYETLYSAIPSFPSKRKESTTSTTTDCPLYSTLHSKANTDDVDNPVYSVLTSPAELPYAIPTLTHSYENLACKSTSSPTHSREEDAVYSVLSEDSKEESML